MPPRNKPRVFDKMDYYEVISWTCSPPRNLSEQLAPITTIIEAVLDCAAKLAHRNLPCFDELAYDVAVLAVHHQFNIWHSKRYIMSDHEAACMEIFREEYVKIVATFIFAHRTEPYDKETAVKMENFWDEAIDELEIIEELLVTNYANAQIDKDHAAHHFWDRCHNEVAALIILTDIHLSAIRDWIKLSDEAKNLSVGHCPLCAIGIDPLNSDDGCRLRKGTRALKNGLRGVGSLLHLCYFYAIDQGRGPARAAGLAAGTRIGNLLTNPETVVTLSDLLNPVEQTVRASSPEASEDDINLAVDFSHEISRRYVNRLLAKKVSEKYQVRSLLATETKTGLDPREIYDMGKEWLVKLNKEDPTRGKALQDVICGARYLETKKGGTHSKRQRLLMEYERRKKEETKMADEVDAQVMSEAEEYENLPSQGSWQDSWLSSITNLFSRG